MPSFIASGLALLAAVSSVAATYGTGYSAPAPLPTHAPSYPYSNYTAPAAYGTAYSTGYTVEYFTTTVCETVYYTDVHGICTSTEIIPIYTTSCPLATSTIYAETYYTSEGATYTSTYAAGSTVYPVTTFYPPHYNPSGTGAAIAYPTYATGAATSLKVQGLAAVAVLMVAAAL